MRTVILVTGSNGQLGKELQELATQYPQFKFIFTTREELLIESESVIAYFFEHYKPNYCINCAAYTAVDKAEDAQEIAFAANALGPKYLADAAARYQCKLIHISTDYVFDGTKKQPYTEEDSPRPLNVYGASKLKGEQEILQINPDSIIIRTSWVYSAFGSNFVKTMIRLMATKESIGVINDQLGSPTYAASLAKAILHIITVIQQTKKVAYRGIYHYSSDAVISWYDFAIAIKEILKSTCIVKPITTAEYPTPAKRSSYSVLDKTKIKEVFGVSFNNWKAELEECMQQIYSSSNPE
jgi:dTDP-4-dehydrorhamnose reductase